MTQGGVLVALATLMYAPVPIQKCLLESSVKRISKSSFHCTLKNLQPGLQNFPTLWSSLISASSGYDSGENALSMISCCPRSFYTDFMALIVFFSLEFCLFLQCHSHSIHWTILNGVKACFHLLKVILRWSKCSHTGSLNLSGE